MKSISRRQWLQGASGAVLAIPFLESLASREARSATPPRRLIVIKSFSTQLIPEWYPTFEGNGYQLKNAVYSGNKADGTTLLTQPLAGGPYTWAPLSDFETAQGVTGILGPSLNRHLSKLTLIRGLDFLPSVNHNYGGILGNYSSCTNATPCDADSIADIPTIDQVLAYSSKFYERTPWARHLHVSQGVSDSISYSSMGVDGGPVTQLKARTNPRDAWNDLFAGVEQPSEDPGEPRDPNRDRLLIDQVYEDYERLRKHPRLSAKDKELVEQYIGLISELQAKLSTEKMLACTIPAEPESLEDNSGTDPTDIARKWELFLDVVVAGLMCDQTRIVTIGAHKALGPGPDPNDATLVGHYHSEDASGGTWHGLAHDWSNPNARRMLQGINSWIASEIFGKLVDRLDVPEADGSTLLDNSLVYWGNEMGFNHIAYSVPCLLAGSAGGFIKPGRYLDYIDWDGQSYFGQENGNVIKGIPHNRLLVTILQAMGLSPEDYERDGELGYGSTSTSGRDPNLWPVDYDFGSVGEILPGIQG